MRKTKIVCTIGPASSDRQIFTEMCKAGMNVARLNFSHGTHAEHQEKIDMIKSAREELNLPIAIMLDTKGPEYRIKTFQNSKILLKDGDSFTFTTRNIVGDQSIVGVNYEGLVNDLEVGDRILLNNGLVIFEVTEILNTDIHCKVIAGGELSDRKSMSFPNKMLHKAFLSEQDKSDLLFGIQNGVDFIAASFVRTVKDIEDIRAFLHENGGDGIHIIAKIENREGVENIDGIIAASDGIMVARGDMGVELPEEEVPILQKMIIGKVYEAGKQVITATQMLDSMMKNPRPTRAEVADVANAIYDGTSAIMLSGETAAGKYPVESVQTMVRIANRTEADIDYEKRFYHRGRHEKPDVTEAVCHATCTTAYDLNASAIVAVTKSGRTARMISRYRPACPVLGGTTSKRVWRQMAMSWGVCPILLDEKTDVFALFDHAVDKGKCSGLLKSGDLAVITSGVPIGISGTTNMLKVVNVE